MSERERADLRDAQRDAELERAWRNGSTEQPSARLDAAILAAAREAAGGPNESPVATPAHVRPRQRWSQWAPLAAAAAVAGLAFTLVQTLPRDPERAPTPAAQEPATIAAPAGAPTPEVAAPAVAPPAAAARQGLETPRAREAVSPVAQEKESTADLTAAPQAVPMSPAARNRAVDAAMTDQAAVADDWVEKIMALHAAGDLAAAEDALRAFRATEPNADRYLPEQLREWAGEVR